MHCQQAALKAAKQTKNGREDEIAALRAEIEVAYANSGTVLPWILILITM